MECGLLLGGGLGGSIGVPVALGILGHGGGQWSAGVLGGWLGVGVWVLSYSGISPLWGVPGLWPQHLLLGPLWIADHCGTLGCWGLWVPWGSSLGFSVWEWPLSHA